MPANVHNAIQSAVGKVFDALRGNVFFSADAKLVLLKDADDEREFETIAEVSGQWLIQYSRFRQAFEVKIAQGDAIAADIAQATHIGICRKPPDDENDPLDLEIYTIREDDTLPPLGMSMMWTLYCERFETGDGFRVVQ